MASLDSDSCAYATAYDALALRCVYKCVSHLEQVLTHARVTTLPGSALTLALALALRCVCVSGLSSYPRLVSHSSTDGLYALLVPRFVLLLAFRLAQPQRACPILLPLVVRSRRKPNPGRAPRHGSRPRFRMRPPRLFDDALTLMLRVSGLSSYPSRLVPRIARTLCPPHITPTPRPSSPRLRCLASRR
jgi:hypothetical protein